MAQLLLANPRKRRRTRRRSTGVARRVRRRRNPMPRARLMDTVQKGFIGGAGALAVDVAMNNLPIPIEWKVGQFSPAVKGLVGVGLGMVVSNFSRNKKLGTQLADGAMTVALYGTMKNMVGPQLGAGPMLPPGGSGEEMGYMEWSGGGDLMGMDYHDDLGYLNPAEVTDWDPSLL